MIICVIVVDMEMLELVEMGIRDQLYQCGFVGSDIPFIYGAALKALEGPDGEWGDKIMELMDAVDEAKATKGQPTAIIMKSVKGKNVSFMENNAGWHGSAPNEEQYNQAIAELDEIIKGLEASL